MFNNSKPQRDSVIAFRCVTPCSVVEVPTFRSNMVFPTSASALACRRFLWYTGTYLRPTRRHVPQNRDPTSSTLVSRSPITNTARYDQSLSLSLSITIRSYLCTRELCGGPRARWRSALSAVSGSQLDRQPGETAHRPVKIHEIGARRNLTVVQLAVYRSQRFAAVLTTFPKPDKSHRQSIFTTST
jgi:hypothetical protein